MAGTIDIKKIKKLIAEDRDVKRTVLNMADQLVNQEKNQLIDNFSKHPVSRELSGGENSSNISNTLGGYGNLFSFIGFSNGSNPISPVIAFLKTRISVNKKVLYKNNTFTVKVLIPSKEDLADITKMPWEGGRSWLWDIERSISGLGAYLFGKFQQSRSGSGIQTRKKYKGQTFKRVSYFTPLYNNFIKRLGGRKSI